MTDKDEHTPEGIKLLELLRFENDWDLGTYKDKNRFEDKVTCLVHKKPGIKIILSPSLVSGFVYVAFGGKCDCSFLNRSDHAAIGEMAGKMIARFRLAKPKEENSILIGAIMDTMPGCPS